MVHPRYTLGTPSYPPWYPLGIHHLDYTSLLHPGYTTWVIPPCYTLGIPLCVYHPGIPLCVYPPGIPLRNVKYTRVCLSGPLNTPGYASLCVYATLGIPPCVYMPPLGIPHPLYTLGIPHPLYTLGIHHCSTPGYTPLFYTRVYHLRREAPVCAETSLFRTRFTVGGLFGHARLLTLMSERAFHGPWAGFSTIPVSLLADSLGLTFLNINVRKAPSWALGRPSRLFPVHCWSGFRT